MNTQNRVDFRGKTQVSLDGVKCTPEHHERPRTTVTAAQVLAVATAWEQCADEARDDAARLGMDPDSAMMAIYAAEERMLRSHAAALRSLLSPASGTVAS
jgi:hypothetical protein